MVSLMTSLLLVVEKSRVEAEVPDAVMPAEACGCMPGYCAPGEDGLLRLRLLWAWLLWEVVEEVVEVALAASKQVNLVVSTRFSERNTSVAKVPVPVGGERLTGIDLVEFATRHVGKYVQAAGINRSGLGETRNVRHGAGGGV